VKVLERPLSLPSPFEIPTPQCPGNVASLHSQSNRTPPPNSLNPRKQFTASVSLPTEQGSRGFRKKKKFYLLAPQRLATNPTISPLDWTLRTYILIYSYK
jgi:hypothetical protein